MQAPAPRTIAHLLLVDDEDDCHFVTRLVLKKAGYRGRFTSCHSAAEAIRILKGLAVPPDILLVDINMPGMSGFEFVEACEALKLLPNGHSSVVMFSSSNRPCDVEAARRFRSVIGYVEKALTVEQFENLSSLHLRRA